MERGGTEGGSDGVGGHLHVLRRELDRPACRGMMTMEQCDLLDEAFDFFFPSSVFDGSATRVGDVCMACRIVLNAFNIAREIIPVSIYVNYIAVYRWWKKHDEMGVKGEVEPEVKGEGALEKDS